MSKVPKKTELRLNLKGEEDVFLVLVKLDGTRVTYSMCIRTSDIDTKVREEIRRTLGERVSPKYSLSHASIELQASNQTESDIFVGMANPSKGVYDTLMEFVNLEKVSSRGGGMIKKFPNFKPVERFRVNDLPKVAFGNFQVTKRASDVQESQILHLGYLVIDSQKPAFAGLKVVASELDAGNRVLSVSGPNRVSLLGLETVDINETVEIVGAMTSSGRTIGNSLSDQEMTQRFESSRSTPFRSINLKTIDLPPPPPQRSASRDDIDSHLVSLQEMTASRLVPTMASYDEDIAQLSYTALDRAAGRCIHGERCYFYQNLFSCSEGEQTVLTPQFVRENLEERLFQKDAQRVYKLVNASLLTTEDTSGGIVGERSTPAELLTFCEMCLTTCRRKVFVPLDPVTSAGRTQEAIVKSLKSRLEDDSGKRVANPSLKLDDIIAAVTAAAETTSGMGVIDENRYACTPRVYLVGSDFGRTMKERLEGIEILSRMSNTYLLEARISVSILAATS